MRSTFSGEMEQCFEPEVGQAEDLLALLHKADGQQGSCEFRSRADFCGHSSQEHGFSATAGSHDQCVLAGRRLDVPAQESQEDAEFVLANDELFRHFRVGLERPGIELADRTIGASGHHLHSRDSSPVLRGSRGMW